MYIRRNTVAKYFIATFFGAAIFCEWITYVIQPLYWADLKCLPDDKTCTKILFVADPQIQGDMAVMAPLNYIFNWDSDRYLKSTFNVVMKQFKPNAIVFLGDLMDEGSISTEQQYAGYVKRLANIFDVSEDIIQIWLPGDNDIGGENEMVHPNKVASFNNIYKQPPVTHYRDISFYIVNAITHQYPEEKIDKIFENNFRIAVSHYPVTNKHLFGTKVVNAINPNIFFCAHDHESKYITQTKDLKHRETTWFNDPRRILTLAFDEDKQYEVYVPTCSYRMGTSNIGFGAAVLEHSNQQMRYTVFWSSRRFPYLFLYLVILVFIILYCCLFLIAKQLLNNKSNKPMTADMSPLLERM